MTAVSSRRWWALIAISASVLVVGLDLTVLNLALPTLSADLHASTSSLQWFSAAYSLVLAAAMLPAGLLGDRIGRKRLLLVALAVFGVASAACALAGSSGELIAARAVLGLGAAAIMPMSLAVLPVLFTPRERPKAIAAVMGATLIAFPAGPLVGGWLLDSFWWGSVFLINVPVVVLALVAVTTLMPESRGERGGRIDLAGIALSSAGLVGLTYGFIKAGQIGWGSAGALAPMLAGVALLAGFVAWERSVGRGRSAGRERRATGRGQPLVELSLFRSASFSWGSLLVTLVSFALFGLMFAMPQYFQSVRGTDALGSGLRLLPMIGGMVIGMLGATRLQTAASSRGTAGSPKVLVAAGFAVMAAALGVGATTTVHSGEGFVAAWFAVTGLGLGITMPTAMNAALGALSAARSGAGSALISAMRQVGATIGVAILGSMLLSAYRGGLSLDGLPAAAAGTAGSSVTGGVAVAHAAGSGPLLDSVRVAYTHGMDVLLWTCCGVAACCALLALAFLPRRADAPAAQRPAAAGTAAADAAAADAGKPPAVPGAGTATGRAQSDA